MTLRDATLGASTLADKIESEGLCCLCDFGENYTGHGERKVVPFPPDADRELIVKALRAYVPSETAPKPELKALLERVRYADFPHDADEAEAQIISMLSAIARSDDAKDAARYRWLRDYGHSRIVTGTASMSTGRGPYIRFDPPANNQFSGMTLWNEGADAAVDEAMK